MDDTHRLRPARSPVEGTLRLLMTSGAGLLVGLGEITDVSDGGCAIRTSNRMLEPNLHGCIEVMIADEMVALPVITRWVRPEPDGFVVGCIFDGLTSQKHRALYALQAEVSASEV
jgi:hypothetical protein